MALHRTSSGVIPIQLWTCRFFQRQCKLEGWLALLFGCLMLMQLWILSFVLWIVGVQVCPNFKPLLILEFQHAGELFIVLMDCSPSALSSHLFLMIEATRSENNQTKKTNFRSTRATSAATAMPPVFTTPRRTKVHPLRRAEYCPAAAPDRDIYWLPSLDPYCSAKTGPPLVGCSMMVITTQYGNSQSVRASRAVSHPQDKRLPRSQTAHPPRRPLAVWTCLLIPGDFRLVVAFLCSRSSGVQTLQRQGLRRILFILYFVCVCECMHEKQYCV